MASDILGTVRPLNATRFRIGKYIFQVRYEKGTHNVHAESISRLRTNAKNHLGRLEQNSVSSHQTPSKFSDNFPPRQRFKRMHNQDAQREHILPSVELSLDDSTASALFLAKRELIARDHILELISFEGLTVAKFHNALCKTFTVVSMKRWYSRSRNLNYTFMQ